METDSQPGLLARLWRPLTFPIEADFITPLTLDECRSFLKKPPQPYPGILKNYPVWAISEVESSEIAGKSDQKLNFSIGIISGNPARTGQWVFFGDVDGTIKVEGTVCRVTYTSQVEGYYVFAIGIGLYCLYNFFYNGFGAGQVSGYLFLTQWDMSNLPLLFGFLIGPIFCGIGIFNLYLMRTTRRKVLAYLDAGLKSPLTSTQPSPSATD